MRERALRAVIAEDHYLVREGTRRLLQESGRVDTVAAVGTAAELLDAVARLRPDVAITDIRMPPGYAMEGIEAAHRIRREHPEVGVLVLSQHADDAYAHALLEHGADGLGYLLKDRIGNVEDLLRALYEVAAGRTVIDPRVLEGLVRRRARLAASGLDELTVRERDVLREVARGLSNRGIADALCLSASAVEKHISAIFGKLGLPDEQASHRRVAAALRFQDGAGSSDDAP
jgi:DNA-binding NarL/FixJ family response regulator